MFSNKLYNPISDLYFYRIPISYPEMTNNQSNQKVFSRLRGILSKSVIKLHTNHDLLGMHHLSKGLSASPCKK